MLDSAGGRAGYMRSGRIHPTHPPTYAIANALDSMHVITLDSKAGSYIDRFLGGSILIRAWGGGWRV